jgi:hypothetical protein
MGLSPPRTTDVSRRSWCAINVVAAATLAALLFAPLPGRFAAPWVGGLQDFAHVPLMALVPWLLKRITGAGDLAAAAMALGLAIAVEPLQTLVGRSASFGDVTRGAFGIAIFLGWQLAAKAPSGWRRVAVRALAIAAGSALPLAAVWPTLIDAVAAWREFPVLADFSTPQEARRWTTVGCRLECEPTSPDEGAGVGILQCEPDQASPGLILLPVVRNWSRYGALHIDFTVVGDPLPITFSVRDGRRVAPPRRRFDLPAVYSPGRQTVRIDLDDVARGTAAVAPVDVGAVQSFHLFIDSVGKRRTLRLHRIWLD